MIRQTFGALPERECVYLLKNANINRSSCLGINQISLLFILSKSSFPASTLYFMVTTKYMFVSLVNVINII